MKQLIGVDIGSYVFNANAKTITISGITIDSLEQILLITNVTDNIIIYNFAESTLGGTLNTNVITLTYNTATMSDSDRLQIFIDYDNLLATETTLAKLIAPSGAVTDTSVTLTSATTAYAVPASPPTSKYVLYVYNGSVYDVYWRLATGTTLGILLASGKSMTKDMNASQSLYFYSTSAGAVLNESHEVI